MTDAQSLLEEGRQEGRQEGRLHQTRNMLLRLGTRRFGAPDPTSHAEIDAITSVEHLEDLADRLLDARDWKALLSS